MCGNYSDVIIMYLKSFMTYWYNIMVNKDLQYTSVGRPEDRQNGRTIYRACMKSLQYVAG